MTEIKTAQEITRPEFIRWVWVDVTEVQHEERMYIKGIERPIEGAILAAIQWDLMTAAYKATTQK